MQKENVALKCCILIIYNKSSSKTLRQGIFGIGKFRKSIFLVSVPKAMLDDSVQLKKQLDNLTLKNPSNMIEG